ncbi:hypothetical protein MA16_Dca027391 [Dendrobium catenatum]|uniref:Uncharacterized protein n=1 Tax=Dendrobium catenatum TaxID=906689 RepID=A0A2I0WB36_9ASPA|nr:hypothetical protein MA16_Dca027391 [Dendrobium catenatum]
MIFFVSMLRVCPSVALLLGGVWEILSGCSLCMAVVSNGSVLFPGSRFMYNSSSKLCFISETLSRCYWIAFGGIEYIGKEEEKEEEEEEEEEEEKGCSKPLNWDPTTLNPPICSSGDQERLSTSLSFSQPFQLLQATWKHPRQPLRRSEPSNGPKFQPLDVACGKLSGEQRAKSFQGLYQAIRGVSELGFNWELNRGQSTSSESPQTVQSVR